MSLVKSKDDPGCQHLGCDPEEPCHYSQTRQEDSVVFMVTVRERKVVDLSVTPAKRKWVVTHRFEGHDRKELMEQVFSSLSDLNFSVTMTRKR